VGAVEAGDKLTIKLQCGHYHYVVEADLKGFCDNMEHEGLLRRLAERLEDRAFLGVIRKWWRAGILDTTGAILHPVTGTPPGGVVSPGLSNVYLHSVLDLWFEKVVKPQCRGEACLIRYADDYICAFESQAEAERF
jgi:retron-type reverse transcriptase